VSLVEEVRRIAPELEAARAEGDELRRTPDATWKLLHECGILRSLQPARWGGGEVRRLGSRPLVPLGCYQQPRRLERRRQPELRTRHLEPLLDRVRRDAELERHLLGGLLLQPPAQAFLLVGGQPRERGVHPRVNRRPCSGTLHRGIS